MKEEINLGKFKYAMFSALFVVLFILIPLTASAAESSLITETELNGLLTNPSTVILDIGSPETYAQGHIPGAINIKSADIIDPGNPMPSEILTPAQLETLLSNFGISNSDNIYIYGQTPVLAARLWWTLEYYGVANVRMLNGNLQTWQKLGFPVSTEVPVLTKSNYGLMQQNFQPAISISEAQLYADLKTGTGQVIDARSSDEYSGKTLVAPAERRGRIPQTINIYWKENVDADGRFKSPEELKELYSKYGVDNTKPITIYCHSGFQSTVDYFVLNQLLGYQNVSNYDASWIGWSKNKTLPIECDYSLFTIGSLNYDLRAVTNTMDVAPYIKDGRTYLPVRYLALSMGITDKNINWDAATSTVTLIKGSITAKLIMGSKTMIVNDKERSIDVYPEMLPPGRIMLPARAMVEAFGGQITWDESTHQILIFTKDYVSCGS